jgi:hypothetical protein
MRSRLWGPAVFGFSLLFFANIAAFSRDEGRISGNVKSISGSPLTDAIIKIIKTAQQEETYLVARSDKYGSFRKANLTPGTYYLQISHQGYQPLTTGKFVVDPGRTTAMDLVLQSFVNYISNDDDPRNWDLKTVMRSSSDRRLIFRNLPDEAALDSEMNTPSFNRIGAVSLASNTPLNSGSYLIRPQSGQNGITSNFAFAEPINQQSRMILSGQMDFGYGSFWRLRNTYNYRPNRFNDYRISVGYGQMNVGFPSASASPSQLFPKDSAGIQESGVQTLAFGMEGTTKFLDMLSIRYGFDYSRLHYAEDRSFTNPSIQIVITPLKGWLIKASVAQQRISDTNSVNLPDGEQLNLSEPTIITLVGNKVSMSQVRHSEISAERTINSDTGIEFAVYNDQTRGPGLPLRVTTITPEGSTTSLIELNEDRSSQQGARITLNRRFFDFIGGSLVYVFGEATKLSDMGAVSATK